MGRSDVGPGRNASEARGSIRNQRPGSCEAAALFRLKASAWALGLGLRVARQRAQYVARGGQHHAAGFFAGFHLTST